MSELTKQQQRLKRVLERIMDVATEDEGFLEFICDGLDMTLDEYHMDDGFGTEGQCDPRGDFRSDHWSMLHVEDVDNIGNKK